MNLYIAALTAQKPYEGGDLIVSVGSFFFIATNDKEALSIASLQVHESFPPDEGYTKHTCPVTRIEQGTTITHEDSGTTWEVTLSPTRGE